MDKKKIALPLILASGFVMALAGCGEQPTPSSSEEPGPETITVYDAVYGVDAYFANGTQKTYDRLTGIEGGANGIKSFVDRTTAEKTEILGALEKYAVNNSITGLPLYENGGFVMYNPRLEKGTNTYVTGYGFGIQREGRLTGPLETAPNDYKTYLQTYESSDPKSANYLDSEGSQIGDIHGQIQAGYFGTKLNEEKNGYDWYGTLSTKDRPLLVTEDEKTKVRTAKPIDETSSSETSKIWRVYVRTGTGANGAAFRTASTKEDRKAFDNKALTIDDYVNAFRILLCGKYGYYRGTELANQTGYSAIAGAKDYNTATKAADFDSEAADTAWEKVGIKSGSDAEGYFLDFTLGQATNRFYAMYSLAGSLYCPINADFFNLVTDNGANPKAYASFSSDLSASPVDNILSVGPFLLGGWEADKFIRYDRNDAWWEVNETTYRIPGVYSTILDAVNTDNQAAFNEFLAGHLDSAGIPQERLAEFKDDPRATKTKGDAVFKLNVNSTTQEQWNALFGDKGSVAQTGDDSYECKPWMSNKNFVKGLFYSIDRDTFGANRGSIGTINYFSSNYMSDPEGGISYNTTEAHANALPEFWTEAGVAANGYLPTAAGQEFDAAIETLLASGDIEAGQELTIDIWWMYTSQITSMGNEISGYIQDAFNKSSKAQANNLTLKVVNNAVTVWSDVYYQHLMVGQFDLGFGSISGNSLDPLNFMEVLKSDNSSGFTLNWGPDTKALDLEFEGNVWSFDTLWGASDHGIVIYKGQEIPMFVMNKKFLGFDGETDELVIQCTFADAMTRMAEMAYGGEETDEDAEEVLTDLVAATLTGDYKLAPDYFIVSDDKSVEIMALSFWGAEHTNEDVTEELLKMRAEMTEEKYNAMTDEEKAEYAEIVALLETYIDTDLLPYLPLYEAGDIVSASKAVKPLLKDNFSIEVTADDWDYSGSLEIRVGQEIVGLAGDEKGYLDFYYYGAQTIGDTETGGYVIYEATLDSTHHKDYIAEEEEAE